MKTAVIQIHSSNNKSENIQKSLHFLDEAERNSARFILLPEVFTFRGIMRGLKDEPLTKTSFLNSLADDISGSTINHFQKFAAQKKVFILAGSLYERSSDPERAYNSSVLVGDDGKILQVYRKKNLFNAVIGEKKYCESDYFLAGKDSKLANVGEFSVGMSVCYDLRFPELYREYRDQGANCLCVPSAFTYATGQAHWHTLTKARAIENLSYVLAPNQTGTDNLGRKCYGHSLIIDPWGEILAEASEDREEIIYADLSKDVVIEKRKFLGQS